MDNKILLSIVIPTRNRPKKFEEVLSELCTQLHFLELNNFQIIISDNSTDSLTEKIASEITQRFSNFEVQYWRTPKHFESAEEHLAWLYEHNFGEFVWFLGDDDIPTQKGLRQLFATLESSEGLDFLIFKNARVRGFQIYSMKNFPGDTSLGTFKYFVEQFGYWSEISGISNQILRSNKLSSVRLNKIIREYGKIYSHVTHHMFQFGNSQGLLIDEILVNYYINDLNSGDSSSWEKYSKETSKPLYDSWLLSFCKQIQYLESENVIDKNFLYYMFDYEVDLNQTASVIPIGTRIAWFAERQALENIKNKHSTSYSSQELNFLREFLTTRLPQFSLVWIKCFTTVKQSDDPIHYSLDPFRNYWIDKYKGFEIFRIQEQEFLAIHNSQVRLLPQILSSKKEFCSKHQILGNHLGEVRVAIDNSYKFSTCSCFDFFPPSFIWKPKSNKSYRFIRKMYFRLPRNVRIRLRNMIMNLVEKSY